jgi:hypothetical protein
MNLDILEGLGTYIPVVAVVVAIASLASQVRRHTQSLRSQNYGRALDRLAAVQSRLSANPTVSSLFNRGVADAGQLTPEERIQFTWIWYEMFGTFEFMYEEAERGALPPHVWDRWAATVAWWTSMPGVQAWWRARPTPFSSRFSAFIDRCIETRPFDHAAATRWQEFLASQASSTRAR